MTTIRQMRDRWRSVDAVAIAGESMLEEKEQIIGINQSQLYDRGIGKDGQPLPPYTPAYAKRKQRKGIVDIYQSGKLQSEMNLRVDGAEYEINSAVEYSVYVAQRRPTIYGLTADGKQSAWHIIHDPFVAKLKEQTGTL